VSLIHVSWIPIVPCVPIQRMITPWNAISPASVTTNEGTPIFSLLRNIGSSVGISIVQALLTENSGRAHATLAATVAPGNHGLAGLPQLLNPGNPVGLALLNSEVTRQGVLIGYLSDFGIMMAVTLAAIPLLLLIRSPGRAPAERAGDVGKARRSCGVAGGVDGPLMRPGALP